MLKKKDFFNTVLDKIGVGAFFLEIVAAVMVFLAVAIATFSHIPEVINLLIKHGNMESFREVLETVSSLVVGIEFIKMLCRPSAHNVLETIIFLVARHMIVNETTPTQDLISTISIVLLVTTQGALKYIKQKIKCSDKTSEAKEVKKTKEAVIEE